MGKLKWSEDLFGVYGNSEGNINIQFALNIDASLVHTHAHHAILSFTSEQHI